MEDYEFFRKLTYDLLYANRAGSLDEVFSIAQKLTESGRDLPPDLRFVLMAAINGVVHSLTDGDEFDNDEEIPI